MVKGRPRDQPLTNLMQLLILFYYVTSHSSNESITVEPQNNKPLYNEVPHIVNNFLHPSNSKIYENEPIFHETKFCKSLGPL